MYITIAKLCLFIEEQVQVHKQNLSDSCLTCKQLGMDDYGEVVFFYYVCMDYMLVLIIQNLGKKFSSFSV